MERGRHVSPAPRLLALACTALLVGPAAGSSQPEEAVDPRFAKIAAAVSEAMAEHGVPGVALGISFGGAEVTRGFGVTSVDHPLPFTADTLFQVGSITKILTGTVVMRLVEQGKLALVAGGFSKAPARFSNRSAASGGRRWAGACTRRTGPRPAPCRSGGGAG